MDPGGPSSLAGAGFLWLAILLVLTFSDYHTRNNLPIMLFEGKTRFLVPATEKPTRPPPPTGTARD
jgi:hypothetical protein